MKIKLPDLFEVRQVPRNARLLFLHHKVEVLGEFAGRQVVVVTLRVVAELRIGFALGIPRTVAAGSPASVSGELDEMISLFVGHAHVVFPFLCLAQTVTT